MKNTLFFKMLVTYLSLTLGLLILLGVTAGTVFVSQNLSQHKDEMLRECSEITAVISSKYMDAEKRNAALEELLTISRKYDALIQIHFLDPYRGNVSVANITDDNKKWEALSEYYAYMDDISPSADRSISEADIFSSFTNMHTMTLAVQLRANDANIGVLCFTVDITDTFQSISNIVVDMVIIAALAVVFAFFAVLYITERMTRPITEMTRTVRSFSRGQYDARIKHISDDEVGELAKSFNRMADEVNSLEEARRSFVANVSHELRSPLTSMQGFLVAMQDGTIPPEKFPKYLDVVINENVRMTSIVNDILDMARIESGGESVLVYETFDVAETVRTTAITFEARIREKHIEMDLDFSDNQVYVSADKNQIIHVLRNLIDNAVKFVPEGGTITIRVSVDAHNAWISVHNTGQCIADEDMPHIFDRFYKAEKAHTRSSGSGSGLGLSIVKRIIDAHSQTVYAENDNGVRFVFSLKRVPRPKRNRGQ